MSVDVETWAQAHGMTAEEADRELGRRVNEAASRVRSQLVTELGDMGDPIRSMTVGTEG